MLRALSCAFLTAAAVAAAGDSSATSPDATLTVVLDFRGPHSPQAVGEMRRETEGILKDSGMRLDWRNREQAAGDSFADVVLIQFRGSCAVEPPPYRYDELGPVGPLAITYSTDGAIQPFSRVECDKVAASVRSAMWGGEYAQANVMLGRALGRVLAHELVHMLTRSGDHGRAGVTKPGLSPQQLTGASLPLDSDELARLRHRIR